MARAVQSTENGEAPQRGRVYAEDGHEMQLREWINFQEAHMVHFLHQVLSRDPEMVDISKMDEDDLEVLRLSWRMMEDPPESLLDSQQIKWLGGIPEAGRIMEDWFNRFGPLFNSACKQQSYTAESGGNAVSAYQSDLIGHVRQLRRIVNDHTGEFPAVSDLLTHVRSRLFGLADDGQFGEYLDFRTALPVVRVGKNGEGEELYALSEGLLDGNPNLFAASDDAYACNVDGGRTNERRRLVELLLSTPEKIVVLDARPEFRVEKPLRVLKGEDESVRVGKAQKTGGSGVASSMKRLMSA